MGVLVGFFAGGTQNEGDGAGTCAEHEDIRKRARALVSRKKISEDSLVGALVHSTADAHEYVEENGGVVIVTIAQRSPSAQHSDQKEGDSAKAHNWAFAHLGSERTENLRQNACDQGEESAAEAEGIRRECYGCDFCIDISTKVGGSKAKRDVRELQQPSLGIFPQLDRHQYFAEY